MVNFEDDDRQFSKESAKDHSELPKNLKPSNSAITEEISEANELPQPFVVDDKVKRNRSASVFSTTQNGSIFSNIESHQNPLTFMKNSKLEKDVREAAFNDEKDSDVPAMRTSNYWESTCRSIWEYWKPDFFIDHLDFASFKVASRTWLGIFITTVLMVITPVLKYCGAAAYLMIITSCIETAGGLSMAHCFYTGCVDLLFVMFAFAINIIAHAINWSIRGYPTAQSVMAELSELGICPLGDGNCFLHEVHKGRYLTTRTTVVTIIFMMLSLFLCGYAQQKSMFFVLPWVLSAICTIITGIYLNQLPYFTPWTFGQVVIVPMGFSFAVRFLLSMVYFPITSNFKFFSTVIAGMKAVQKLMDTTMNDLGKMLPSDAEYANKVETLQKQLSSALQRFAVLELEGLVSRGEFAYSRLDPGDLGEFRSLVRMLSTTLSGCRFFFDHLVEKHYLIMSHLQCDVDDKPFTSNENSPTSEPNSPTQGHHDIRYDISPSGSTVPNLPSTKFTQKHARNPSQATLRRSVSVDAESPKWTQRNKWLDKRLSKTYAHAGNFEDVRFEIAEELDWDGMKPEDLDKLHRQIIDHYCELNGSIITLLSVIIDWSVEANKFRFWSLLSPFHRRKHTKNGKIRAEEILRALEDLKAKFDLGQKAEYHQKWLETYCNTSTFRSRQHYMYILSMDSFYGCSMERMARCIERMANYCIFLDNAQPSPRLIYPFMKTRSKTPRFESEYLARGHLGSDVDQMPSGYQPISSVQKRNPDSGPPRTVFHLIGTQFMKVWRLFWDAKIQFCFKRAVFTIISSLVFMVRTTSIWSYTNRIIWVPIMTALTVSTQAGDGIYGFVMKTIFTFIGSVSGMVIWYMGDGHGEGNPYGFTAAMGAVMAIFTYFRHFHKLSVPMGAVVLCVTTVLVPGTGWADSHLKPVDISIGWGFRVAWIRFVAVTAGLFISFIGTMFPQPVTAKKQVRLLLGQSIESLGDIQASISNFIAQRHEDPSVHIEPRQDIIIQKLRTVKIAILASQRLANKIRYEPPLGGMWPKHRFVLLMKLMWEMIFLLEDIYFFSDSIKDSNQVLVCLQIIGWTSVNLTSSLYSVLVLSSRSLSSSNALPSVTPGYLSEIYSQELRDLINFNASSASHGIEGLLEDLYTEHDGRLALAMITTSTTFYKRVDGCIRLIKGLVGEIYGVDQSIYDYSPELVPLSWSEQESKEESTYSQALEEER